MVCSPSTWILIDFSPVGSASAFELIFISERFLEGFVIGNTDNGLEIGADKHKKLFG